jgi:drug/metabolite transporter (DMT)-like permease
MAPAAPPSLAHGRLCIVAAAVLWSTSGAFTKLLREHTPLGLNEPPVAPMQIAFFRVLFAGLVLLPTLRRRDLSFRPVLLLTGISFAVMNALFVWAMAEGSAANAILLQYTAPMWMYVVAILFLGERADLRGGVALGIGMLGIGVIVWGGWVGGELRIVLIALGSGVTYAGVVIGLRLQRDSSPGWLTVFIHLFGAAALIPWMWTRGLTTGPQLLVLFAFGALQMGLPYWLMTRGLQSVSPQEAGTLTLLEPLLNPLWAYLMSPATEKPTIYTLTGGACILGALAYRYWPVRRGEQPRNGP